MTLERALNSHHRELSQSLENYCSEMNSQPIETAEIVRRGADYQELLGEIQKTILLKKQISYQKRLLKI